MVSLCHVIAALPQITYKRITSAYPPQPMLAAGCAMPSLTGPGLHLAAMASSSTVRLGPTLALASRSAAHQTCYISTSSSRLMNVPRVQRTASSSSSEHSQTHLGRKDDQLRHFSTSRPHQNSVSVGGSSDSIGGPSASNEKHGSKLVPPSEAAKDRSEPGWTPHNAYTDEELDAVRIVHKELKGASDHIAAFLVRVVRTGFDIATRYPKHREKFPKLVGAEERQVSTPSINDERAAVKHRRKDHALAAEGLPEVMELGEMRKRGICFGPEQWLIRIVFLETIAGVPGFSAAMIRHLQSLRLMRRDKGWIQTLLDDAQNERMHLLVALKLYRPGFFMRTMIALSQAVFTAAFSVGYMIAPRLAHRFVGVLEEEAVITYTNILRDIDAGRLPEWESFPAPAVAKDYWGLKNSATLSDVMRALRADEANHRFINHTLASIESQDFNPFAYGEAHPTERGGRWGLERDEALDWFEKEDAKRREAKGLTRAEGATEAHPVRQDKLPLKDAAQKTTGNSPRNAV